MFKYECTELNEEQLIEIWEVSDSHSDGDEDSSPLVW